MKEKASRFYSDGLLLDGSIFFSDNVESGANAPIVLVMSGFTGLKSIHPARFARVLNDFGLHCFSFDYRGFADSEGTPNQVILTEQARDVRNALAHIRGLDFVDPDRIAIAGWGMGAGVVLQAAAEERSIAALAMLNGFYDGAAFLKYHLGDKWRQYLKDVESWACEQARSGAWPEKPAEDMYPLDAGSKKYVENTLYTYDKYSYDLYATSLAHSLVGWAPILSAPRVTAPCFLMHGKANALHPFSEAEVLKHALRAPLTEMFLGDIGHTEWMQDDDPVFQRVSAGLGTWLSEQLKK